MSDAAHDANRDPIMASWYVPPLGAADDRPVRAVRAMERILPWAKLRFEPDASGRPAPLPDRDRRLLDAAAHGELAVVCTDDERRPVVLHALETEPGEHVPAQLHVMADLPNQLDVQRSAADLLAAVGVAFAARWATANELSTAGRIALQTITDLPWPDRPPPGLPGLKMPQQLDSPLVPYSLGWINYWSKETAAYLGFPDPARHGELLARARAVEGGGWVVQLTDEPLDLDVPAHHEALRRAYELLPRVGGRAG